MKRHWFSYFKNTLLVTAGTLLLAFGAAVFILPFDLVVGGMAGIAISLHRLFPVEYLTVDRWIFLLTWGLFLLGWLILGRRFAAKTLLSAILYPLGIALFSRLADPTVWGGFFALTGGKTPQLSMLLAALFGGILIGTGSALTFLGGGSTGGTDIIAFSICKFFKRLRSSYVLFAVDAATILLGLLVLQDLTLSLLGIASAFASALMVDKVFLGGSRSFSALIVSDQYEAVNRAIISRLQRTTTILPARGGYSGAEKTLLQVSFTMRQYAELMNIIKEADPDAFVTIQHTHQITGLGWTK